MTPELQAFVRDEEAVRKVMEQFARELRHADDRGTRVWHNGPADSNAYCWCWFGERLLAILADLEAKLAAVREWLLNEQDRKRNPYGRGYLLHAHGCKCRTLDSEAMKNLDIGEYAHYGDEHCTCGLGPILAALTVQP